MLILADRCAHKSPGKSVAAVRQFRGGCLGDEALKSTEATRRKRATQERRSVRAALASNDAMCHLFVLLSESWLRTDTLLSCAFPSSERRALSPQTPSLHTRHP
ncbi:hypothetical protein BST61_g993 [Cercospora zeina]